MRKEIAPNTKFKSPTIKTELIGKASKKSDPNVLKTTALETIDSYPKDWAHVYTDGSAFKATVNAGSGAIIYYPDKTTEEIMNPCGAFCSNYAAEQQAIDSATTHLNHRFDSVPGSTTNVVIFTDSLSALQTLESGRGTDRETTLLRQNLHHLMNHHSVDVVLQWIPGHSGIKGNDVADTLAKNGAALPQPDVPVNYETAVQIIKSNIQEEWLNDWASNTTGRVMYRHMSKPNPVLHTQTFKKLVTHLR